MSWDTEKLPSMVRADMQDAARRRGAPLPPSAPKVEVAATPHFTECPELRLPRRRRVVSPRRADG